MGRLKVTQAAITRTIKAAKAAGEQVIRVETAPDGAVSIYLTGTELDDCEQELAEWVKKNARKA